MSNELIEFNVQETDLIKKQLFPTNATNSDVDYCMGVAKALGLNPITKEIWFVERKSKVNNNWVTKIEPMAGRDSYIKIAHRSGMFEGITTSAELKKIPFISNDIWDTKDDLVAVCMVYKKGIDKAFIAEVNYNEYVQLTREGKPTKFWAEKPITMLKKVAESQALRKAFNITCVYDDAEIREEYQHTNKTEEKAIKSDSQIAYDIYDNDEYTAQDLLKKYQEYDLSIDMMKKFNIKFNVDKTKPETFRDIIDNFDDYFSKFEAEILNS